ncbi:hypothetical protein BU23DRAFT_571206 [Bimuria novae-zelandiae CBS 107.79]|uniref:Uncharacterized protein n=1 Tax=Bimuria novae-zelandiae CBS 107.79 TaxID=1447943 RepID=A0A6A5UXM1_9PLEO|nr:hypothetical protein BU23DRAFT_571206 [Bimuria novae-zelandiae CBS 107.79]
MEPLTVRESTPAEIQRKTKIDSMKKYLSYALRIDQAVLRASFDTYTILDISFRTMFSGPPVNNNILARCKIFDAIAEDFFGDNEAWFRCQSTSFLVLKEYTANETRSRMNHECYATMLARSWHKPDLAVNVMYPIEDPNSEIQDAYLLRAFTLQLGGAMLEKYYDETLQEVLLRVDTSGSCWLDFLRLLVETLKNDGNDKRRVFVILHGARADQAVRLIRVICDISSGWLSPIFQLLISGQGANKVAEEIGCPSYELPFPDEYSVQLTPMEQPDLDEDVMLHSMAARQQWKVRGRLKCEIGHGKYHLGRYGLNVYMRVGEESVTPEHRTRFLHDLRGRSQDMIFSKKFLYFAVAESSQGSTSRKADSGP